MNDMAATSEGNSVWVLVLGVAFGFLLISIGRRAWRARSASFPAGPPRAQALLGDSTRYQSFSGIGHIGVPVGTGFIIMGAAATARRLLGRPEDWWLMYVGGAATILLWALTTVYLFAYFWVGVPDWMRPPAQRGWRLTKHGYELVRPEAVPPHLREPQRREQERW